jgi:hypothetical protein
MSANQLIAKALSTASEEEAIACLRMARKKSLKMNGSIPEEVSEDRQKLINLINKYNELARSYNALMEMRNEYRQQYVDSRALLDKTKSDLESTKTRVVILGLTTVFLSLILLTAATHL